MNYLFRSHKYLLILVAILVVVVVIVLINLLSLFITEKSTSPQAPFLPTPTSLKVTSYPSQFQPPFKVVSTTPADRAINVPAAEQVMLIKTDTPILSPDNFSLSVTPSLSYPMRYSNTYPTQILQVNIIGGFKPSTRYTFTLRNRDDQIVAQWSFTTGTQTGQGQSGARTYLDEQIEARYYPLNKYLPYSTLDFTIQSYSDHLTLKVIVKSQDLEKVKREVNDWIISKGINPGSHKINYVTQ